MKCAPMVTYDSNDNISTFLWFPVAAGTFLITEKVKLSCVAERDKVNQATIFLVCSPRKLL